MTKTIYKPSPITEAPSSGLASRIVERAGTLLAQVVPDPPEIRDHAPVLGPLLFVLLINVAAARSLQPAVATAFASTGQDSADTTRVLLWVAAFLSPFLAFLKSTLLAALAWALVTLFDGEAKFRVLLSANVYGQEILALPGLVTALILRARGLDAITSPRDLVVPQGMDAFLDFSSSPVLTVAAQQTTVYHGMWLCFMIWLLPRVTRLTRSGSILVIITLVLAGFVAALIRGLALS